MCQYISSSPPALQSGDKVHIGSENSSKGLVDRTELFTKTLTLLALSIVRKGKNKAPVLEMSQDWKVLTESKSYQGPMVVRILFLIRKDAQNLELVIHEVLSFTVSLLTCRGPEVCARKKTWYPGSQPWAAGMVAATVRQGYARRLI